MKYLFFISWLRAREKKLADQVDFDRMVSASNMEESFRVLNDTDYAPYLQGKAHSDIEEIIEEERKDFRKNLLKMGMDKDFLDVLFFKDDMSIISKEIKKDLFEKEAKGGKSLSKKKDTDTVKEIKKASPEKPEDVDDILLEKYFQKTIDFLKKNKEKSLETFFSNYSEIINKETDFQKRDESILKMENEIIEKGREDVEGAAPIFAFFIKKRRAEHFIRTIFSGKRMNMDSREIYKLLIEKRAL